MYQIEIIDIGITNFINSLIPHNQFFNYFFSFFSLRGNSFFIWAIIIILILIFEERKNPGISKRDISFVSTFLICFIVSSFLSQILIKNIVMRPRPCSPIGLNSTGPVEHGPRQCPKDYSFPSSHATTAFAAAGVIATFDKKRKWFYYLIASLISLSRIYLGVHYFFDVVIGLILGLIISNLLLNLKILKSNLKI